MDSCWHDDGERPKNPISQRKHRNGERYLGGREWQGWVGGGWDTSNEGLPAFAGGKGASYIHKLTFHIHE